MLGIPLALEKVEGPSLCLTFLGITLNTQLIIARLPEDKLSRIKSKVAAWLSRKKQQKGTFCPWKAYCSMPPKW